MNYPNQICLWKVVIIMLSVAVIIAVIIAVKIVVIIVVIIAVIIMICQIRSVYGR